MPTVNTQVSSKSADDSFREFVTTVNIQEPVAGKVIELIAAAPWDCDVVEMKFKLASGTSMTFQLVNNASAIVCTGTGSSGGTSTAVTGSLRTGTCPANTILLAGNKLYLNLVTDTGTPLGMVVQVKMRRRQT